MSKAFGEALGRYYADRYGLQVACLRIGTFADTPPDARSMATWLSPADCARLVDACLRTDRPGFALVWGISANRDRWWSLDAGRAARLPAGRRRRPALVAARPGASRRPSDLLVGGIFTEPCFGIDEVAERSEKEAG